MLLFLASFGPKNGSPTSTGQNGSLVYLFPFEDARGGAQEVTSVLDSAFDDDDSETVKGFSDDGYSYFSFAQSAVRPNSPVTDEQKKDPSPFQTNHNDRSRSGRPHSPQPGMQSSSRQETKAKKQ